MPQDTKPSAPPRPPPTRGAGADGAGIDPLGPPAVSFRTMEGEQLCGRVLRFNRHEVVFQTFGTALSLRSSQTLAELRLGTAEETLYTGPATLRGVVDVEGAQLVSAALPDSGAGAGAAAAPGDLAEAFRHFVGGWQGHCRLQPRFRLVVDEMESFFDALRIWSDGLEARLRADGGEVDQALAALTRPALSVIDDLFGRLEETAGEVPEEARAAHWHLLRRRLHPLLLCAPFAWRTFAKPLGYAGDYEMVNMLAREPNDQGSLFARLVNLWFLRQPPALAHRNRLEVLVAKLRDETLRIRRQKRRARVFTLGCGPALEMQQFLEAFELSSEADFVLADFNPETLDHVRGALGEVRRRHNRRTGLEFRQVSVLQLLREARRAEASTTPFTFIYCAGLFDYLPDPTCRQLLEVLYARLEPGGLLLATNVEPSNPMKHGMSYLLDWHLLYRTADQFAGLRPAVIPSEAAAVWAEPSGYNLFLEIHKPVEPPPA